MYLFKLRELIQHFTGVWLLNAGIKGSLIENIVDIHLSDNCS